MLALGAADHVGVDPGEVGHADVDAEVADLDAQDVEQLLEPGLGGAVGAEAQRRDERGQRGDAEHVAAARDDVRQARVDHAPVADEVDVRHRGEDVGVQVAQRAGGGDARVGDADVDAAALGHDVVDRGGHRVGIGDVAARPHGVAEGGRRPLDALGVEVEQGDAMGGRQAPGGLEADAVSGAGDDGNGTGHVRRS